MARIFAMTAGSVNERRWRAALRELRVAAEEYNAVSPDVPLKGLGEGTEANSWLRLRRAVAEYEEARDDLCRELVIDQ